MSEKYTDEIIQIEFDLFDKVNNEGGRAACQDDFKTFEIMRGAQFDAWNEEMRKSYLEDLNRAKESERNLVLEKYAYMSGYSYMGELDGILEKQELIQEIMPEMLRETINMREAYPNISKRSRPMGNEEGELYPLDSYLLCEIMTYSVQTLRLFRDYLAELTSQGKNLPMMILENTAKRYGFKSLDEAEQRM